MGSIHIDMSTYDSTEDELARFNAFANSEGVHSFTVSDCSYAGIEINEDDIWGGKREFCFCEC